MEQPVRGTNKRNKLKTFSSHISIKDIPNSHELYQEQLIAQFIDRRHELQISQRQLGEIIGVTDYLLAKWEGGHRRPTGFLLWCWAESLGIKLIAEVTDGKIPTR
jgi:transcriptional regulator with XRE-family HTH domain